MPSRTRDTEKRRRVMARSMALGHCICNPRLPCPCETLQKQDVCLCAGERLEAPPGPVRLTLLVERPGCASKVDQAALKRMLGSLPPVGDPRVLVGVAAGDDAGVYQLSEELALVQTVDVFTPCVDDPYTFGQIAATNSVNDVYAMGGVPLTALSILGFPSRELPDAVCEQILRGGLDKMAEAGVAVIGGHTLIDHEIKAGFAVTGRIDPRRIISNGGACPGDALVLTKPLGTGIIAFAAQIDRAPPGSLEAAARSMTELNRIAARRMVEHGAHACTDVTGFGLLGHLGEMAARACIDVEIDLSSLPLLPGVLDCLRAGIVPGSIERNRESAGDRVVVRPGAEPDRIDVCFDAQTCGGLLVALPHDRAASLVGTLHADGLSTAAIIGSVLGPGSGRVFLGGGSGDVRSTDVTRPEPAVQEPGGVPACCAAHDGEPPPPSGGPVSETARRFQEFLRAANAPGELDARTRQAMTLALSIATRCEPCTRAHLRKARDAGITSGEIEEAAWLAISFGGSPALMFYKEVIGSERAAPGRGRSADR